MADKEFRYSTRDGYTHRVLISALESYIHSAANDSALINKCMRAERELAKLKAITKKRWE